MIVQFDCDECGPSYTSTLDAWLIRGGSDRVAMRCPKCQRLIVGEADPFTFSTLLEIGVLVIGDAELELLREFENPNPPC